MDHTEAMRGLAALTLATARLDEGHADGGMSDETRSRLQMYRHLASNPALLHSLLQPRQEPEWATTQCDVPLAQAGRLLSIGRALVPEEALQGKGREWQPHVTLLYGLKNEAARDVAMLLRNVAPLKVTLGATAFFPGQEQTDSLDVVYLPVQSDELEALHEKLAGAVPHFRTHASYKPHVTLAYVQRGQGQQYAGQKAVLGKKLLLDSVTFIRTDGKRLRIKLSGTPTLPPAPPVQQYAAVEAPQAPPPPPPPPPRPKRQVREVVRDPRTGLIMKILEHEEEIP